VDGTVGSSAAKARPRELGLLGFDFGFVFVKLEQNKGGIGFVLIIFFRAECL
jgi:hypothetical protein